MSKSEYGTGRIEERSPDRWQITIELEKDPLTGRRHRHRFTIEGKRRDAQKALRAALTQRDTGTSVAADKITVAEWLTRWLERHAAEGHIGLRAQERYTGIIQKHLIPSLGAVHLQQLRADHINDLKAAWLTGKRSTASKPLAGATVHKHLVVLREALADALRAGAISRNPMDAVTAPSVKAKSERRALTESEITTLLTAAGGTAYNVVIRFALATGMREGEILAADWDSLDLEAATLAVSRNAIYVHGTTVVKTTKTSNSRRTIELSPGTVRLLRAHRAAQVEHRLHWGAMWQESGLIFPWEDGTNWINGTFSRGFRTIVAKAAIADPAIADPATVHFHTLRHTAASQWIRLGADIFTVSRRLGHASASFTMDVYGHMMKGQQQIAAEALDHLLAVV